MILRIISLEEILTISWLNLIHISADDQKQLKPHKEAELHKKGMYNDAICLADGARGTAPREFLESIVKEEEGTLTGSKNNWITSRKLVCL